MTAYQSNKCKHIFLFTCYHFKDSLCNLKCKFHWYYLFQLTPPMSMITNPTNCVTTKFIRTSTNKFRCPIFCLAVSVSLLISQINIREYQIGNKKRTIQKNWQHWVHMMKKNKSKTQHTTHWTTLHTNNANKIYTCFLKIIICMCRPREMKL